MCKCVVKKKKFYTVDRSDVPSFMVSFLPTKKSEQEFYYSTYKMNRKLLNFQPFTSYKN